VGDTLHLREYVKALDHYTGREVFARVLYLLTGGWHGLMEGYVVMSIALKQEPSVRPDAGVDDVASGDSRPNLARPLPTPPQEREKD
jgi:hypothetical protein